jgi:hypothetical protein
MEVTVCSAVPSGLVKFWDRYPALKRRAIFGRPYGTAEIAAQNSVYAINA